MFDLKNPKVTRTNFDRPNLSFAVRPITTVVQDLQPLLVGNNESSIVYTLTKKREEEVTEMLKKAKINFSTYHAEMSVENRRMVREQFLNSEIHVVVATTAFGMHKIHKISKSIVFNDGLISFSQEWDSRKKYAK